MIKIKKKEKKEEVSGIWKYLHHLLSGLIILIEGITLLVLGEILFFSLLFVFIGGFLVVDDILAETIDKSVFNKIHSNPINLKIGGIIFFVLMEILFVLLLVF